MHLGNKVGYVCSKGFAARAKRVYTMPKYKKCVAEVKLIQKLDNRRNVDNIMTKVQLHVE